jgi:hypothetical protein
MDWQKVVWFNRVKNIFKNKQHQPLGKFTFSADVYTGFVGISDFLRKKILNNLTLALVSLPIKP